MLQNPVSPVDDRTRAQRSADAVTEWCGSWSFVFWCSFFLVGWITLNTCLVVFGKFDPYPFILFNLVLTVVSTLQGPLIMMSQNRQADRDRKAVHEINGKLDDVLKRLK